MTLTIERVESAAEAFAAGQALAVNASARVAVIGLGNTGSVAANLLARSRRIRSLCLVDFDRYEEKNVCGQLIVRQSLGVAKAEATAQTLLALGVNVEIAAHAMRVQDVPVSEIAACDVVCGNLDSREARRFLGELCWRVGVPYVDCGVFADGLLARVTVIDGGPDASCLQCTWSQADYDALEQTYPCAGSAADVAPTNAPLSLGALAASLQVVECEKFLGAPGRSLVGRELLIDAAHNRHMVSEVRRNPRCRFPHALWANERRAS